MIVETARAASHLEHPLADIGGTVFASTPAVSQPRPSLQPNCTHEALGSSGEPVTRTQVSVSAADRRGDSSQ
jgi:hypothetical protein